MTVQGSDNFADAPTIVVPTTGDPIVTPPTPNGTLTMEAGEKPTGSGGATVTRSAWWKLTSDAGGYATLKLAATNGSGYTYFDFFRQHGTDVTGLEKLEDERNQPWYDTYIYGVALAPGDEYYVRASLATDATASDYVLTIMPNTRNMTPVALPGINFNDSPPSMNPTGDYVVVPRRYAYSNAWSDSSLWFGMRDGGNLEQLAEIDFAALTVHPHRVMSWSRWITEDTWIANYRFGTYFNLSESRLVVAHISGGTVSVNAYALTPGLAENCTPAVGAHYANGLVTMLVKTPSVLRFVTFNLTGAVMSNLNVGAPLPFTSTEASNYLSSYSMMLPTGDAFVALQQNRVTVSPAGQKYTQFPWEWGPDWAEQLIPNGGLPLYVNGRLWVTGAPRGSGDFYLAKVDPYTGVWEGSGGAPFHVTDVYGYRLAWAETSPGRLFVIWSMNSNDDYHMYVIDVSSGVPEVISDDYVTLPSHFIETNYDGSDAILQSVQGEEPAALLHIQHQGGSSAMNAYHTYNWYPAYVEPILTGGLRATRRAFVG